MTAITRRVVLTTALAAAAFAAGALAEDAAAWAGAAKSHKSIERFDMSVGVTAGQAARRPVQFEEVREVYAVPSHYGTLVSVTGDPKTAVLWYSDGSGILRNVRLDDPAERMYEIRLSGTSRLEVDARER
jgi:hypothetical protein